MKTLAIFVMIMMIIINTMMINMRMESSDSVDFLFFVVTQNWRPVCCTIPSGRPTIPSGWPTIPGGILLLPVA